MTAKRTVSRDRKYSTRTLFYEYWVLGESVYEKYALGASAMERRGIPVRDAKDAQDLRVGNVELHELWDEYLSDFQQDLARELNSERIVELGTVSEDDTVTA